jgi:hypothetical protein
MRAISSRWLGISWCDSERGDTTFNIAAFLLGWPGKAIGFLFHQEATPLCFFYPIHNFLKFLKLHGEAHER